MCTVEIVSYRIHCCCCMVNVGPKSLQSMYSVMYCTCNVCGRTLIERNLSVLITIELFMIVEENKMIRYRIDLQLQWCWNTSNIRDFRQLLRLRLRQRVGPVVRGITNYICLMPQLKCKSGYLEGTRSEVLSRNDDDCKWNGKKITGSTYRFTILNLT